jgi:uncharacterized membrane protein
MNRSIRSVIKGLSWRAFAAFDTMVAVMAVSWFRTGHINPSVFALVGGIVGMELVTKTFLFAVHERLWERQVAATVPEDRAPANVAPTWQDISARMVRDYAVNRKGWAVE